jgi:hypothetical protein
MTGAGVLKIAVLDEVDERTAILKVVSKRRQAPEQALETGEADLPGDWYLRLARRHWIAMRASVHSQ